MVLKTSPINTGSQCDPGHQGLGALSGGAIRQHRQQRQQFHMGRDSSEASAAARQYQRPTDEGWRRRLGVERKSGR